MTISTSNAPAADALPAAELLVPPPSPPAPPGARAPAVAELPHTVWSRFIILLLCLAVVTTTLAFGTVHAWALGIFQLSAAAVVVLWVMDAWRTGTLRVSRNLLQLPLVGLIAVGVVQLSAAAALTHDPHSTRYALVQLSSLFVYFAAALAFVDSPRRLRVVVRTVIIFGFLLALYGLMQHFVNPATIFFVREPKQAAPFGPYINRHHFAGYMELTLALPLGLILAGAVERERVILYAFVSAIMAIALVMTNSRGGMLSLLAEVFFLTLVAASVRRRGRREERAEEGRGARVRALAARLGLGFAMVLAVLAGVLYFGGEEAITRMLGTVNAEDPTTGRAHFWQATWRMIQDRPLLGAGLGAFSAVYPQYDTANGLYRLEQAHNDYLQLLSDAGVVGFILGLVFVVALLRMAVTRMQSPDKFRRGVALGALAGCAGVLVHSFFDFTLHTTANALLFLLLAALATVNGRVEEPEPRRRRRRRRTEQPEREQLAA
jgi:O-antigen ligase